MSRTRAAVGVTAALIAGGITVAGLSPHLVSAVKNAGERPVVVPITTCRAFDTRANTQVGDRGTPLGADETWTVRLRGEVGACEAGTIPDDATGVVINLTALNATAATYVTAWTAGEPLPLASSANPAVGGQITPNTVTIDLNDAGEASFYNLAGTTDLFGDISAYLIDHDHTDTHYTKAETYTQDQVDQQIAVAVAGLQAQLDTDTLAPWREIPSGRTVTGVFNYNHLDETEPLEIHRVAVTLPGRAPVPLTNATVNFAKDDLAETADDDEDCEGSAEEPTAAAGKVCLYLAAVSGYDNIVGTVEPGTDPQQGFYIVWRNQALLGGQYLQLAWAYTAP